jgi:hypothetical protein
MEYQKRPIPVVGTKTLEPYKSAFGTKSLSVQHQITGERSELETANLQQALEISSLKSEVQGLKTQLGHTTTRAERAENLASDRGEQIKALESELEPVRADKAKKQALQLEQERKTQETKAELETAQQARITAFLELSDTAKLEALLNPDFKDVQTGEVLPLVKRRQNALEFLKGKPETTQAELLEQLANSNAIEADWLVQKSSIQNPALITKVLKAISSGTSPSVTPKPESVPDARVQDLADGVISDLNSRGGSGFLNQRFQDMNADEREAVLLYVQKFPKIARDLKDRYQLEPVTLNKAQPTTEAPVTAKNTNTPTLETAPKTLNLEVQAKNSDLTEDQLWEVAQLLAGSAQRTWFASKDNSGRVTTYNTLLTGIQNLKVPLKAYPRVFGHMLSQLVAWSHELIARDMAKIFKQKGVITEDHANLVSSSLEDQAVDALEQIGNVDPEMMLATLELELEQLKKQPKQDEKAKQHVKELENQIQLVKSKLGGQGGQDGIKDAYHLKTVFIPSSRPEPVALNVFVRPEKEGLWKLIDFSDGKGREYTGQPDPKTKAGSLETKRSAIENAFQHFAKDSRIPNGRIAAEFPESFQASKPMTADTSGLSGQEALELFLTSLSVIAGGAAMIAMPVLGAGIAVVRTLALVSMGANIAANSSRILDRLEHGVLEWDEETQLDLLGIAGSLTAGTTVALQASGQALSLPRLSSALILGTAGSDVTGGMIIAGSSYQRIQQIQKNEKLSPAQKQSAILEVLRTAALTGALLALNLNGARGQLREGLGIASFDVDMPRVNKAILELEKTGQPINMGMASELKGDAKVRNTFAGLEYDQAKLRDEFGKFQSSRTKQAFGDYLGSSEVVHRTGLQQNPKETLESALKIKASEFNQLSHQEQNAKLMTTTEPVMVQAIETGTILPKKVQKALEQQLKTDLIQRTITSSTTLVRARENLMKAVNKTIGANLDTIEELQDTLKLVNQPASRGSIGDTFAGVHVLSKGTNAIEQPLFTKDMIPGLENPQSIRPDRIRPVARRTLDIKTGYEESAISDRQLRDVDRMIEQSQIPGSKVQSLLESTHGIKGGLIGQDILILPSNGNNVESAARRAFQIAQAEQTNLRNPVSIYFTDNAGMVHRLISPNKSVPVGTRLPD